MMDQVCKDYQRVQTTQEKVFGMISTSVLNVHIGFTVSLKPCLNLCSFKSVNCSLKRDDSFTPIRSWTLHKEFSSFSVIIDFLNLYIDFAFLTSGLSLFH